MKIRIQFNRVNMQRGDSRVWSALTSKSCNMGEKIVVKHKGVTVLETVYNPTGYPRGYMLANGTVRHEDGAVVVEI